MITTDHDHDMTCRCGDLRDLVTAALHDLEAPPCPVHRPGARRAGGPAGFALNDDAAITAALGMTNDTTN